MEPRVAWIKERFERATGGLVRVLADRGVSPTSVSLVGLAICLIASPLIGMGWMVPGAVVFGIGSMADAVDGALARRRGIVSDFGAFLDSTIDRVGEAAGLAALAAYFANLGEAWAVVLAVLALFGGNLTSYVRAKAESLGIPCEAGLMSRAERVMVFTLGLLFQLPHVTVCVLALATIVTGAQRFMIVQKALAVREAAAN